MIMDEPSQCQVSEAFLPRRYQEEIFHRAQTGNVVAALDTGSGKTFISTLLIRWITSVPAGPMRKVVMFLVPKVPLVDQQGDFISAQTPLRVCKLSGIWGFDIADRITWQKRFNEHDVFVATAQIFLNLITHAHWGIDKVSLIVFDECHHARKNHPYAQIMREYFQEEPDLRPKIFGMTASPIWNPSDTVGSLNELEKNLDAKVIGVRQHIDELMSHVPKPIEIVKEYPIPPETYDYPSPTLRECLDFFDIWTAFDIPWMNIKSRYFATYENLGPYCAELYLYSDMKHRISKILADSLTVDEEHMDSPKYVAAQELLQIDDIVREYGPFFDDPSRPVNLLHCSPKVLELVSVIASHISSNSKPLQGIIFVEQRQVAACLARILPTFADLNNIQCADLIGQESDSISTGKKQSSVVKAFRDGEINLVISTSVAEEGLDFPACDIVVRFDSLQHMVGYLQSRGRARNKASKFVIMVQEGHSTELEKYQSFMESEPMLKHAYRTREELASATNDESDDEDEDNLDLNDRERYVVQSTKAVLTYDTSISLINNLCALMDRRDPYSPPLSPKYSGSLTSTLVLPAILPIPRTCLTFKGPFKHSKKEAKRAVAFMAVKKLHELNVFDDYLLPGSGLNPYNDTDADGKTVDPGYVPVTMDVLVRDPWVTGNAAKLWIHQIWLDNRRTAAIVTGSSLPGVELNWKGVRIQMKPGRELLLNDYAGEEMSQIDLMDKFTKLGIEYCNTGRVITTPLSCFLVPLDDAGEQPNFEQMECLVKEPLGNKDWTNITEGDYGRLMVMNSFERGHPLILHCIRYDLSAESVPPPGSREFGSASYREYYVNKYTNRKGRPPRELSFIGPLVEAWRLPRTADGTYDLKGPLLSPMDTMPDSEIILVPQCFCRWINLSHNVYRTMYILPRLCHRITDVYRAHRARIELSLPFIAEDFLVEALTLPAAMAGWSNQRLETLGDSVLKLTVTVHLFNKYPYRHEGQLSIMRRNSVCNRTLLVRAKECGLETFLSCEVHNQVVWQYTTSDQVGRYVHRQFPRRSLQDCMEATLGAAFITGGIPMALRAGEALGMAMGGVLPWPLKYSRKPESSPSLPLFEELQGILGYEFHRIELLAEAVTHPSILSSLGSTPSYQRLEFLGDALIDLVVLRYLFDKFPKSTSDQLSWPRTRVVSSSALAAIAIQKLSIQKVMLINSVELSIAISKLIPLLLSLSPDEIVNQNWKFDPPKAISDVFEAIMGAILVDSAYNFEKAASIVEFVMGDVLDVLSPCLRRDPVSELLEWAARDGCTNVVFQKIAAIPKKQLKHGFAVSVHGIFVTDPVTHPSLLVAKSLAAERALLILRDVTSEKTLKCLCTCGAQEVDAERGNEIVMDPAQFSIVETEKNAKEEESNIKAISDAAQTWTLREEVCYTDG